MAVSVLKSTEFVLQLGIHSETHPAYQAYYDMYSKFMKQGVAGGEQATEYIPTLEDLERNGKYVQKRENGNTVYGGQTELWIAVEGGHTPVAFITVQHFIPVDEWRGGLKAGERSKHPEIVYIAHFYSGKPGMGAFLLQYLCANAWLHCTLCLEVEHGIADPTRLKGYYEKWGFIPCPRLPYTNYWRIFLMVAAREGYFTVTVRGPGSSTRTLSLMEPGENVCMDSDSRTWFIRPS